jgi:hypothetical protein
MPLVYGVAGAGWRVAKLVAGDEWRVAGSSQLGFAFFARSKGVFPNRYDQIAPMALIGFNIVRTEKRPASD